MKGIKIVWPLNMLPYKKEEATKILETKFGWGNYNNKHYEDVFTRFYEGWWLPKKFDYDKRRCYYSSLILTGQMSRDEALHELTSPPYNETTAKEDIVYICNKLGITEIELNNFYKLQNTTYRNYNNNYYMIRFAVQLARLFNIEKRNLR